MKKVVFGAFGTALLLSQCILMGDMGLVHAQVVAMVWPWLEDAEGIYTAKANLTSEINMLLIDQDSKKPVEGACFEFFVDGVSLGTGSTDKDGKVSMTYNEELSLNQDFGETYVKNYDQLDPPDQEEYKDYFKNYQDAYDFAYNQAKTTADQMLATEINNRPHTYKVVEIKAAEGYEEPDADSYKEAAMTGSATVNLQMENKAKMQSVEKGLKDILMAVVRPEDNPPKQFSNNKLVAEPEKNKPEDIMPEGADVTSAGQIDQTVAKTGDQEPPFILLGISLFAAAFLITILIKKINQTYQIN